MAFACDQRVTTADTPQLGTAPSRYMQGCLASPHTTHQYLRIVRLAWSSPVAPCKKYKRLSCPRHTVQSGNRALDHFTSNSAIPAVGLFLALEPTATHPKLRPRGPKRFSRD